MQFRTLGTLAQVSQFVSKVCLTLILCTFRFQVLWVFPSLDTRSQLQASQDAGSSGRLQLLSELLGSETCEYWNRLILHVRFRRDPQVLSSCTSLQPQQHPLAPESSSSWSLSSLIAGFYFQILFLDLKVLCLCRVFV